MSLWPKEHGAYGQLAFPLIAAFAVAGMSAGGLFVAASMIAAFLAHEPASVLLGLRGGWVKRELGYSARRWLACCVVASAAAGVAALLTMPPSAHWSIGVPLVPGTVLVVATSRGTEKSWYGETAAALAFSGAAVPVSLAGGVSHATAAIPFALLFVSCTLAVRIVTMRGRHGRDLRTLATARRAALALAVGGGSLLALLSVMGVARASILAASAPGLLTAAVIALRPPPPSRLRALGWTLVAVSVVTTALVVLAS